MWRTNRIIFALGNVSLYLDYHPPWYYAQVVDFVLAFSWKASFTSNRYEEGTLWAAKLWMGTDGGVWSLERTPNTQKRMGIKICKQGMMSQHPQQTAAEGGLCSGLLNEEFSYKGCSILATRLEHKAGPKLFLGVWGKTTKRMICQKIYAFIGRSWLLMTLDHKV